MMAIWNGSQQSVNTDSRITSITTTCQASQQHATYYSAACHCHPPLFQSLLITGLPFYKGGSAAEWLACWTHAQKARVQIAVATLSETVLGKLFTPIVPLFTKQENW